MQNTESNQNAMQNKVMENTESGLQKQEKGSAGLLPLVNELRHIFETKYNKKIEDLEFKILENEELISQMGLEISMLKAKLEEKDLEIYRMHEEISESKISLEQLVATLNKMQD